MGAVLSVCLSTSNPASTDTLSSPPPWDTWERWNVPGWNVTGSLLPIGDPGLDQEC